MDKLIYKYKLENLVSKIILNDLGDLFDLFGALINV